MNAANSGDHAKTEFLISAGADVNQKTKSGYTALIAASFKLCTSEKLVEIAECLINHGAELDCQSEYGESAINAASHFGRFDVVELLLKFGARADRLVWTKLHRAAAIGSNEELDEVLKSKPLLDEVDYWERTPFLLSVIRGDLEKAQRLLHAGSGIENRQRGGMNALMLSCMLGSESIVEWLIQNGASVDVGDDCANTPLMYACQNGHRNCVDLLLKAEQIQAQKCLR